MYLFVIGERKTGFVNWEAESTHISIIAAYIIVTFRRTLFIMEKIF